MGGRDCACAPVPLSPLPSQGLRLAHVMTSTISPLERPRLSLPIHQRAKTLKPPLPNFSASPSPMSILLSRRQPSKLCVVVRNAV